MLALAVATALQPWRALPPGGPPLPWGLALAVLPVLWSTDVLSGARFIQPLSGAPLLVLMMGWPLAVPTLALAAAVAWLLSPLGGAEVLARLFWLGLLPATLAVGLGWAVRRGLPNQLFVYILARGFFVTLLALVGSAFLRLGLGGGQHVELGLDEQLLSHFLTAWGEAMLTGMLVAVAVAFRPQWLATYSDRLYLRNF